MKPELDPYNMLTRLSSADITGCLEVADGNTTWSVFLQSGQLLGVDCSIQSLGQLVQRLRQLGCDLAAKAVSRTVESSGDLSGENLIRQEIDRLSMQGLLDQTQASQVAIEVTKEALESLLWLKTGSYKWDEKGLTDRVDIKNSKFRLSLSKLMDYYQQRLTIWQRYITIVQSPHQRPYLINHRLLENPVAAGTLSPIALTQLVQLMRGMSLRELALILKQDELKITQLLIPYIRANIICLREPPAPFNRLPYIPEPDLIQISANEEIMSLDRVTSNKSDQNFIDSNSKAKVYKIACIDDSPLILDEIERFLGRNSQYLLTKIADPIKASSLIFRLKPDLILMDITMPDINGYKLCHLFRSSAAFEKTPIIMVTGNKGLLDKARAKVSGATNYLTKPFTETELLELVGKYLV